MTPSTPFLEPMDLKTNYFSRTTMAPIKSPFFQSFLVVLGWLLWQFAQLSQPDKMLTQIFFKNDEGSNRNP
jgi:hypothetical protein